jgi:hypothetical protein
MRRDRSKAYRKIAQLEKSIKEKERVIVRYKKRMQRDRTLCSGDVIGLFAVIN